MIPAAWTVGLLSCLSLTYARPSGVPRSNRPSYQSHPERATAVEAAFQRAWDGYYTYAFPHDSLRPISKSYQDDRNGWGASAIDALSTALVMGNKQVIGQIVDYIPKINFDKPVDASQSISLFETTIRYLAGLLSAHDLLSGPLKQYVSDSSSVSTILEQAVHLANNLQVAFSTTSGVPINDLYFEPPRTASETTNGLATIGSLVLEWTRLSDKTGNKTYAELSQKGESYLLNPQPAAVGEPFPGLVGTDVYVSNGQFVDSVGGWNGGDDSFYEYLIKMFIYDSERFSTYKDRWIAAVDSSMKYLASHPTSRPDLTFLAAYNNAKDLSFNSGHLACFAGGNIILGGLTLDRQDYINFGLKVVEGCHDTYVETYTGIGPEGFAWQDNKMPANATNNPAPPADQKDFYDKAGFWLTSDAYILRPEVMESYYYAYRATGNSTYQDWAWDAFQRINATCSAGVGFADIADVNAPNGGGFIDNQETFFFAEVMKYSYLIQADEAPWQVSATHDNQFVFNTEAHPMRVAGRPI